jgi:hypothetical protein
VDDVEPVRLRFAKEPSASGPVLSEGESVLWSARPNRWAYFFYWFPRAGLGAAAWTASWAFVAFKNRPLTPVNVDSAVPLVLAFIGVAIFLALPVLCYIARRYLYLITSERVVIFDALTKRSRSVDLTGVDRFVVVPSSIPGAGSIRMQAGTISGADGIMPLTVRVIGANAIAAAEKILRERTAIHG